MAYLFFVVIKPDKVIIAVVPNERPRAYVISLSAVAKLLLFIGSPREICKRYALLCFYGILVVGFGSVRNENGTVQGFSVVLVGKGSKLFYEGCAFLFGYEL